MFQTGRSRAPLLVALAIELLLAGWWRWPWTTAAIETGFDYGSGHVAVVSENWRRAGALAQHFLPVMSTDRDLPEWPYRTLFSQEYYSVPPLAFMLHYAATRILPGVEPVLLAKLLAQAVIAASVLGAAALLAVVFDRFAIFAGMSFLISGVPYLLWYSNGYFAVNVGQAVQLVLAGWCAQAMWRGLAADDAGAGADRVSGVVPGAADVVLGGGLAFLGAFADYMPLAANATAFIGLVALAWSAKLPAARRFGWQAAAAVAIGSIAAVATTVVLYGRQMGFERYRFALTERISERSGDAPLVEHFDVIGRQMLLAWPVPLLAVVGAMVAIASIWSVVALVRRPSPIGLPHAVAALFALAVSAVPSLGFHYRAINYVRLHWWFTGTWTIALAVGTIACVDFIRRRFPGAHLNFATAALVAAIVATNVRFAAAKTVVDTTHSEAVRLYRSLGDQLPHDGLPLLVTDITSEWPGLFEDFPFATAYLRRPVLLRDADGRIRLPVLQGAYDGKPLVMGGEEASERLRRRGGDLYIAYDPAARRCQAVEVPVRDAGSATPIAVCRASARQLVDEPLSVLGPVNPDYVCSAPPLPPANLHVISNRGGTVAIAWSRSATSRAGYILEVGRAAGQSGALVASLGRATDFTAHDVLPGAYFVRVRGHNRCGSGAASNELAVVVR